MQSPGESLTRLTKGGSKYAIKLEARINSKTGALITALTGLTHGDEDGLFDGAREFVGSNFRLHRFLDSDKHQIQQSYEGISEKLEFHSHTNKATKLRQLYKKYLAIPVSSTGISSDSREQQDVLSFLLRLSGTPTAGDDCAQPIASNVAGGGDNIGDDGVDDDDDASAYDSGDSWSDYCSQDDLEFMSDVEDGDDDDDDGQGVDNATTHDDQHRPTFKQLQDRYQHSASQHDEIMSSYFRRDPLAPIRDGSVASYHVGDNDSYQPSRVVSTSVSSSVSTSGINNNIGTQWSSYQHEIASPFSTHTETILSETHVVKETLWMLRGFDTWLYQRLDTDDPPTQHHNTGTQHNTTQHNTTQHNTTHHNTTYHNTTQHNTTQRSTPDATQHNTTGTYQLITPRACVRLAQTTPLAFSNSVKMFCRLGTLLTNLRLMVAPDGCLGYNSWGNTTRALGDAVSSYLKVFDTQLMQIEVARLSLSHVAISLRQDLLKVRQLSRILTEVTDLSQNTELTKPQRVAAMLSILYKEAVEVESVSESCVGMRDRCIEILVEAARPILVFLSKWIVTGQAQDPFDEFPIVYAQSSTSIHQWHVCHLRQTPGVEDVLPMGLSRNLFCVKSVPDFLRPSILKILAAGRSARVLRQLGLAVDRRVNLFQDFVECTRAMNAAANVATTQQVTNTDAAVIASTQFTNLSTLDQALENTVASMFKGIGDTATAINTTNSNNTDDNDDINTTNTTTTTNAINNDDDENNSNNTINNYNDNNNNTTIINNNDDNDVDAPNHAEEEEEDVDRCFTPATALLTFQNGLDLEYRAISKELLHVLNTKFSLTQHLQILRQFFLFESGSYVFPFCIQIFEQMLTLETLYELDLTDMIQRAVTATGHRQHAQRISASLLSSATTRDVSSIQMLKGLRLHYEVPSAIQLLVNPTTMAVYDEVFTFLIQLQWVKWRLDGIKSRGSKRVHAHRAWLLRSRIMHAVHALYSYILTRILHSLGLEFQQKLSEVVDLDDVCQLHMWYVTTVKERCLLTDRATMVRNAISKIMKVALHFRDIWDSPPSTDADSDKIFQDIETDFNKCCHFLTTVLGNMLKNGAYVHLSSLHEALATFQTLPKLWN